MVAVVLMLNQANIFRKNKKTSSSYKQFQVSSADSFELPEPDKFIRNNRSEHVDDVNSN